MYKIYKISFDITNFHYYYILCNECIEMSWFYFNTINHYPIVSCIYNLEVEIGLHNEFSSYLVDCIYESPNLQEAASYLEQLRVIESV